MSRKLEQFAVRNLYKPGQKLPCLGKPFALKNRVGDKKPEKGEASCLGEMSIMMDCWKTNKFSDGCSTEVKAFEKCVADVRAKRGTKSVELTSKEINQILIKNPIPKS